MNRRRGRWGFRLAVAVLLTCSVAAAVYSTTEAVEERQVAEAAMELRLAVADVVHADEVRQLGGEIELGTVATSVEVLEGDHSVALHALALGEVASVKLHIQEILGCGLMLLDESPAEGEHPEPHDHDELQALLAQASERAATEAGLAEQNAGIALAVTTASLIAVAGLGVGARYRSEQARNRAEAHIREGQRLQALMDDSPDSLFVIDGDGAITYRSVASERLLDPRADSIDDLLALSSPGQRAALRAHLTESNPTAESQVFDLTGHDGASGSFELRVSDLSDDVFVGGHLVAARDITTETQLRRNLEHQASTDSLTRLPNRRVLPRSLETARQAVETTGSPTAVLSLDIDGFKTVNDTLGHPVGDVLLAEVAARLSNAMPANAHLIRMGGDEFAVVLPSVTGVASAQLVAQTLLDVLDEPFTLGERLERVRTTIGIAVTSEADQVLELLTHADIAMYEGKRTGGDTIVVYEAALERTTTRKTTIIRGLREADYDAEFSLVYQPIVDAGTQQTTSLEALLRWSHPTLGNVRPDEFIPIAEVTGEICRIGKWVLDQACHQLAVWMEAGIDPDITVSFNVSPRQLAEEAFVSCVLETAARWGVPTTRLVAEVTESAALDHTGRAQGRLQELRDAGLLISIDDFGSGYSNLGQLLAVPFDIIKIDRSLLLMLSEMREQAGGDPSDPCSIMQAIVSIASVLDAPVVCEGVETEEQRTSLQASGITHFQGYLTGRPAAPRQITADLTQGSPIGPDRVEVR